VYFDETAWVAVAFIIFIALIWKKASNAIVSILDNRSLLIHNELNEAKSLKEEALEELRKSLQTQKQVSEEAENIISDAKETAKKIQEEAYSKSSDLIKRKEEQAKQKIIALETDALKKN
jgi:F-type H+-transporting ATPase subunit b